MLPQLQSIEQVREAVSFLRYPPIGVRGVALRTRGAGLGSLTHGDVARVVNERIVGIVQIESRGAVAAADEIAALDEVDVLFVGPADLSHALGVPGRFDDPTYLDALRTVVDATKRHGKAAGILLYDAAGPRAPPRTRVPVHRPRVGGLLRVGRGDGDAAGGRPRLIGSSGAGAPAVSPPPRAGSPAAAHPPAAARSGR